MSILATEDLRTNYYYVVSTDVVRDVRHLLDATAGMSSAVWQQESGKRPTILDLAGLGSEIWQEVVPKDYVNQLRGDWDAR